MLIGSENPGPAVAVGLTTGNKGGPELFAFSTVTKRDKLTETKNRGVDCSRGCTIELKGDTVQFDAIVDGHRVARWRRAEVSLTNPYIQINAEVGAPGDRVSATLSPRHLIANGNPVLAPSCAFTINGVEPSGSPILMFKGSFHSAPAEFVDLLTGRRGGC
ncbi:MAG: hypothetical protein JOZ38_04550 [Candidatus Eremiobacteraeota bacterium]|nr:hypothetical protein [Candidatus Eremiobacteraeota bacterium]